MEQMTDLENELIDKTKEYLRRVDSGDIAIPDTLTYDAYGIYLDGIKKRFDEEDDVPITHADFKLLFELCVTGLGKETPDERRSTCLEAVKGSALYPEDQNDLEILLKSTERPIGVVGGTVPILFEGSFYGNPKRKLKDEDELRKLMKSLVDVHTSTGAGKEVYRKAQGFPGVKAGTKINGLGVKTISKLLHCTSPEYFPLYDGNDSNKPLFAALDICIPSDEKAYLHFAQKMRDFLCDNCRPTNLRVLDYAARDDDIAKIIDEIRAQKGEKATTDTPYKESEGMTLSEQVSLPSLNTILYGPPGTGKTYSTVKYAVEACDPQYYEENKGEYDQLFDRYEELVDEERIVFTTFHQSFGYEDFIEGIRPVLDSSDGALHYELSDGIFKSLCDKAKEDENENDNFVIIIDEINRGNVARIFGELITLLEDSKRLGCEEERQAILPYSGEPFGVPENVYVLGTMNTADRSLTQLDTALRRRFDFVEIAPDPSLLHGKGNDFGIELDSLLKEMNERIERLYDREHKIGHSYLIKVKSFDDLKVAFEKKIIPLLQEYFYDDYDKIRQVLSDRFVSNKGDGKSYELVSSVEWVPGHFVEIYSSSNSDESAEAE